MPFLYIYSPDDFVEGLPAESGAMAAGTPDFVLTLKPGATPTLVEITDDDLIFDEVDGTQSLTNAVNIDGNAFGANTTINTAYDLINTTSGHKLTSFHFGGDGYQQGAVDGVASTVPLQPGTSYTFDSERTSHQKNNQYQDYFACFVSGTRIDTVKGPRRVETLRVGDLIDTFDRGPQPLRMVLTRRLLRADLAALPNMRPVLIEAGAMGAGLPLRDLRVSPQHRMLIASRIAGRLTGDPQALLAAKKLTPLPGIQTDEEAQTVTYHHLVFDAHQVIFAEGTPTESFYPGPGALAALPDAALREFETLFPDVICQGPRPARPIPSGKVQKTIVARHALHAKPLLPTIT